MPTGTVRIARLAVPLVCHALVLMACADLPRDPEGTLERVRGGTLRVGAVEAPPWIVRAADGAAGPEAELVAGLARSLDARVAWDWAPIDDHIQKLERYELDLVAAGLTATTAWRGRVALTRPWHRAGKSSRVLAVAPGENGFLTTVDRYVEDAAARPPRSARARDR